MTKSALVLAYTRPSGVSTLLKSLDSNQVEHIYVSLDGPRNELDKINQVEILRILSEFEKISKSKIFVRVNQANLGVAGGTLSALDWFFGQEKEGLILEDDLVVGDDFYRFAFAGLEVFRDDLSVWMISGTQLFPNVSPEVRESWTSYPMIWGWGGWAKKWHDMRFVLLQEKRIPISKLVNSRYLFWSIGANRALEGKVDTWDSPLAFEFWNLGKKCIVSPVNLISNIGDDSHSTHTTSNNSALRQEIHSLPTDFQFRRFENPESADSYNRRLETEVFRIRKRHILLPYYSVLLDWLRFPKKQRKKPLNLRTDWNNFRAP